MWFLLFFIVTPFILFIGFLLFSVLAIFLVNRIFHKKYSQFLSLILPCFSIVFYFMLIMGGISFKYFDPQYYEFKRLCKEAKSIVYDEELYRIYNNLKNQSAFQQKYYDERTKKTYIRLDFPNFDTIKHKISKHLYEHQNFVQHNDKIFLYYQEYFYHNYGIFIKGDEGAGFHIDFDYEVLKCKPNISYKDKD